MPATRSRTSTEQPAEVAAEEVKQVQEEGSEIVPDVPAQTDVVQPAAETAVVPEPELPASEPAAEPAVAPDAVTNGSAEPVAAASDPVADIAAETNGESDVVPADTNGSAAVSNGVAAVAAADESEPEAVAEAVVSDAKRKSEVGDGDAVPDSTEVKKQKVAEAESVAEEAAVDATA